MYVSNTILLAVTLSAKIKQSVPQVLECTKMLLLLYWLHNGVVVFETPYMFVSRSLNMQVCEYGFHLNDNINIWTHFNSYLL